jgi:hypothetical protein
MTARPGAHRARPRRLHRGRAGHLFSPIHHRDSPLPSDSPVFHNPPATAASRGTQSTSARLRHARPSPSPEGLALDVTFKPRDLDLAIRYAMPAVARHPEDLRPTSSRRRGGSSPSQARRLPRSRETKPSLKNHVPGNRYVL